MISKDVTFRDQGFEDSFAIVGLSVGEAKTQLRSVMKIPYFSDGLVNNENVSLNYVLRSGDRLEFRKRYGVKSGDDRPFEEREARGLFDAYELVRIADDVKRRNLPMEEGVDFAMLKFSQWAVETFGEPPDLSAQKVLAAVNKLMEETVRSREPRLCPYRFQRVGEIWHIHFPVDGEVRTTAMKDSVLLRQMACSLRHPHDAVPYEILVDHNDPQTQAIIAAEKNRRRVREYGDLTVKELQAARKALDVALQTAKENGDEDGARVAVERIADFECRVGTDEQHYEKLVKKTEDEKSLLTSFRKSAATNRRRLFKSLRSKKHNMGECAAFLETYIFPEGSAVAYRPLAPAPDWVL